MKKLAVFATAMTFTAAVWAQSAPPSTGGLRIDLDQPAAPEKPAPKADDKKKDDGKKKADEPGKIEGMAIPRGSGFMGLQLVNNTFKLSFYDAKKKPVAPDVIRANLRWNVRYQSLPERAVLNRDGDALTSEKVVKPPHSFILYIILVKEDAPDAPVEDFTVDFKG